MKLRTLFPILAEVSQGEEHLNRENLMRPFFPIGNREK